MLNYLIRRKALMPYKLSMIEAPKTPEFSLIFTNFGWFLPCPRPDLKGPTGLGPII